MGRTVYGVDLEESPFGGLIEKLLTEEELEKLADGGPPGAHAAPDGGSDDGDADDTDDEDWSVSDDTYEPSGDAESDDDVDSETGDAGDEDGSGTRPSGASSWSPSPSSPPPSTARDDDSDGSESGYGESTGFGSGAGPGASGYEEEDGDASFLSKHRWLLLKVAVALAALAAVGVVVWGYRDRLAGLVPGRGGDGADEFDIDEPSAGPGDEGDASPARQRAKIGEGGSESDADGGDERRETPSRQRPRRDEADVETPGQDLDLGALVGLGVLTLVAALVRKYDEERNRPHDPLVDGPLDEGDDDQ
jgi:hypothetical protein